MNEVSGAVNAQAVAAKKKLSSSFLKKVLQLQSYQVCVTDCTPHL